MRGSDGVGDREVRLDVLMLSRDKSGSSGKRVPV